MQVWIHVTYAGVVDQGVDMPVLLADGLRGALDGNGVRDVELEGGEGAFHAALGFKGGFCGKEFGEGAGGHDYVVGFWSMG